VSSASLSSRPTDQITRGAPSDPSRSANAGGGSISIAFSGGGIRASLFSLGTLVALVQTGENRSVAQISSVSGGSITNAAIAQSCEFSKCESLEHFDPVANPLASRLCGQGAFLLSGSAIFDAVKFLAPKIGGFFAAVIAALIGLGYLADYLEGLSFQLPRIPWLFVAAGILALLVVAFWAGRGLLQEALYGGILASLRAQVPKSGPSIHTPPDGALSNLANSSTRHVIISTDLVSGAPVYFSRDFVACPYYGWGSVDKTRTATAVYASAAFPIGYPPRRVALAKLHLQKLKLTDGGVHNNLGIGWFDEIRYQHSATLWQYGNRHELQSMAPSDRQIIVNSGAASRRPRRVPWYKVPFRTMSILYDNTVKPRLEAIRSQAKADPSAPAVIDVTESPYHLAEYYENLGSGKAYVDRDPDLRSRAGRVKEILEGARDEPYWIEFARHTSSTRTKLTKAGLENGARIIWHGYLSTIVSLHSLWKVPLPSVVLDEGYFLDMGGRPKSVSADYGIDGQGTEADSQVNANLT
jgi:predicted acylesterase/phospholipase RssA